MQNAHRASYCCSLCARRLGCARQQRSLHIQLIPLRYPQMFYTASLGVTYPSYLIKPFRAKSSPRAKLAPGGLGGVFSVHLARCQPGVVNRALAGLVRPGSARPAS